MSKWKMNYMLNVWLWRAKKRETNENTEYAYIYIYFLNIMEKNICLERQKIPIKQKQKTFGDSQRWQKKKFFLVDVKLSGARMALKSSEI